VQHLEQLDILMSIVCLCRSSHVVSGSLFVYSCTALSSKSCFFQRNLMLLIWTLWTSKSEKFFELRHKVSRFVVRTWFRIIPRWSSHSFVADKGHVQIDLHCRLRSNFCCSCWLVTFNVSRFLDTRISLCGFCDHQNAIVLLQIVIKRLEQLLPAKLFGFGPLRCMWDSCWTKLFRVRFFSEYFCFPMATEGT
jgi:hypothetical protein